MYENEVDFRKIIREKLELFGLTNQTYLDAICNGMFAKVFKDAFGSYTIPTDDVVLTKMAGDNALKYEFKSIYSSDGIINTIELFSNEGGISISADFGDIHFYAIKEDYSLSFGTLKDDQVVTAVFNMVNNEIKSGEVTRTNVEGQDVQIAVVEPIGVKLKASEYYAYTPKKQNGKTPALGGLIHKFDKASRLMPVKTSRAIEDSASYIPNIVESTIQEMDKDIAIKEVKGRRLHK